MSHTPTKSPCVSREHVITPVTSSGGRRRPPALGGASFHQRRIDDTHRRHSSSISYRKTPTENSHYTQLEYTHSIAPTSPLVTMMRKRHSLQATDMNSFDSMTKTRIITQTPTTEAEIETQVDVTRSDYWPTCGILSAPPNRPDHATLRSTSTVIPNHLTSPTTVRALSVVEQHGDLLTFIAKKERRCLDLREELQKSEDELRKLKRKWEIVIGRSLASPTMSGGGSSILTGSRRQQVEETWATSPLSGRTPIEASSHGATNLPPLSAQSMSNLPSSTPRATRQAASLPGAKERECTEHEVAMSGLYGDRPQQFQDDSMSWDPLLQRIAPVSSVAKKWVGDIGKGFLDLLNDTHESSNHTEDAPLRTRNSTNDLMPPTCSQAFPEDLPPSLNDVNAPLRSPKKSITCHDKVSSKTSQESSSARTSSIHLRTDASSPSSNFNSFIESHEANSSTRTSLSSGAQSTYAPINPGNIRTEPSSGSPLVSETLISSSLALTNENDLRLIQSHGGFALLPEEPATATDCEALLGSSVTSVEGDKTPICELSNSQRPHCGPSAQLGSLRFRHSPTKRPPKKPCNGKVDPKRSNSDSSDCFDHSTTASSDHVKHSKHQSRRSTFDFFSSTTGQWTANLTKKLEDITNSETYRTSKRATMNFVDTVEKTLAEVIVSDVTTRVEVTPSSTSQSNTTVGSFAGNNQSRDYVNLDGHI